MRTQREVEATDEVSWSAAGVRDGDRHGVIGDKPERRGRVVRPRDGRGTHRERHPYGSARHAEPTEARRRPQAASCRVTSTNRITRSFKELRLLVVTDPCASTRKRGRYTLSVIALELAGGGDLLHVGIRAERTSLVLVRNSAAAATRIPPRPARSGGRMRGRARRERKRWRSGAGSGLRHDAPLRRSAKEQIAHEKRSTYQCPPTGSSFLHFFGSAFVRDWATRARRLQAVEIAEKRVEGGKLLVLESVRIRVLVGQKSESPEQESAAEQVVRQQARGRQRRRRRSRRRRKKGDASSALIRGPNRVILCSAELLPTLWLEETDNEIGPFILESSEFT
ncbi:hypothetical protein DFH11DRAFT_1550373 [Phellopilus nigrolimitatus]|nr:hypothetical protein DFH11DRAFT_1550373 [Phellopilus nigrolimitatus]